MTDTRILTALYADHAAAERAAERLRAIGVPDHHIEMHRSDEGDVVPGQHLTSGGLFGALSGLLGAESDLRGYERGLGGGCTVSSPATFRPTASGPRGRPSTRTRSRSTPSVGDRRRRTKARPAPRAASAGRPARSTA